MAYSLKSTPRVACHKNVSTARLIEMALLRREGRLSSNGALAVETGRRTGRSPQDRYIVDEPSTSDVVNWGADNQPISPEIFDALWEKSTTHIEANEHFVSHLHVGSDSEHYLPMEIYTETAWHNLFAQLLFIRPEQFNPMNKGLWTILSVPGLTCDPQIDGVNSDAALMINFARRKVLVAGLRYAGEIKKSMFAVQNFLLPEKDVLPMHCAANTREDGHACLFFGLSGTGKTTLSADPGRLLIGDDEHGWSKHGVFNLEGGCYAKCINLKHETEPVIWNAIRYGAIMENVVIDPIDLKPDYSDGSLTQNTRACYPREHIPLRMESNKGGEPSTIIFLTCDLSGVLPPVSMLSPEAAAYHFLSGYTARVGSTEVGATRSYETIFSACYGAPFFPRRMEIYAELLIKRMTESGCRAYLLNTGWTGGDYQVGQRFPIPVTRSIVSAIQDGDLEKVDKVHLPLLNLDIPKSVPGVESKFLNPRETWQDQAAYDIAELGLVKKFTENFSGLKVSPEISLAGPRLPE